MRGLLARTSFRITRSGALNRFDAIPDVMRGLRARGFAPHRIVDCGANVGAFALKAHAIFPGAIVDMIDPQPACLTALRRIAQRPGFTVHPFALTAPESAGTTIQLVITPDAVCTGAHVASATGQPCVGVQAVTLDQLMHRRLGAEERVFLKLDLQGYELQALRGGEATLGQTEVILTEVSFFAQSYEPPILELMSWFDERGFALYDIAALSARARDGRTRQGDFVFVQRTSPLATDTSWA